MSRKGARKDQQDQVDFFEIDGKTRASTPHDDVLRLGSMAGRKCRESMVRYIEGVAQKYCEESGAEKLAEQMVAERLPKIVKSRLKGVVENLVGEYLEAGLRKQVSEHVASQYVFEISVSLLARRDEK